MKGLYAHSAINPIAKWTIVTDAAYIPTYLTRYDEGGNIIDERKEIPLITLNVAVQKDNGNRSSVASTQKQGRKRGPESQSRGRRAPRARPTSLILIDSALRALPDPRTSPEAQASSPSRAIRSTTASAQAQFVGLVGK